MFVVDQPTPSPLTNVFYSLVNVSVLTTVMALVIFLGYYWIDPNDGPVYDAIRVFCDFAFNATCIYPNRSKVK